MLLHSFDFLPKGDMALQQRNKRGFQLFFPFFFFFAQPRQVIKAPVFRCTSTSLKKQPFAMVMLPLKKETPITAIVSRACDTIAITLPIMTPCITRNLVFRILSPWNGGVEGSGGGGERRTGICRGWERGAGTPVQAHILPMILFLSPLRPSHANRGHL